MIDKRNLIFVFCIIITLLVFYIDKIQYGNRKIVTTHPKYMMNKHVLNCNTYNFYGFKEFFIAGNIFDHVSRKLYQIACNFVKYCFFFLRILIVHSFGGIL